MERHVARIIGKREHLHRWSTEELMQAAENLETKRLNIQDGLNEIYEQLSRREDWLGIAAEPTDGLPE